MSSKFLDPTLLNGTYTLSGEDKCHVQWYEGMEKFYVCIEPAAGNRIQLTFGKTQTKKFLKQFATDLDPHKKILLGIKEAA